MRFNVSVTKYALKRAVADVVPERVASRTKQGFAAPTADWFAGRHGTLLRTLMAEDALRRYFDVAYLDRLLRSAGPGDWQTGHVLWPILNFGLWQEWWLAVGALVALIAVMSRAREAQDGIAA